VLQINIDAYNTKNSTGPNTGLALCWVTKVQRRTFNNN